MDLDQLRTAIAVLRHRTVNKTAAAQGLALSCWTVDAPDLMVRLLRDGVDAMISNDIRALVSAVPAHG